MEKSSVNSKRKRAEIEESKTSKDENQQSKPKSQKKATNKYESSSKIIYFKSNKANGYAWLSNFWPDVEPSARAAVAPELRTSTACQPFEVKTEDGEVKLFKTVEHYFHFMKYHAAHPTLAEGIRKQGTALKAKMENTKLRKKYPIDRQRWHESRLSVMRTALKCKFANSELRRALLATGSAHLSEVPGRGANEWAGGPRGDDLLGKLLVELREELRKEDTTQESGSADV